MQPHIADEIPPNITLLHARVKYVIAAIPDRIIGPNGQPILVSCHHVARVVSARVQELDCVDGMFAVGYEHSWLQTPDPGFIIDPYPIGVYSAPLLISLASLSPWKRLYDAERKPDAPQRPGFVREVVAILNACMPRHAHALNDSL